MIKSSQNAQSDAVLAAADAMCAAARTAPKTKGQDFCDCCIITDGDKDALADKMEELSKTFSLPFFARDAQNVRQSEAVVLFGTQWTHRGLNASCGYCHFSDCRECTDKNGLCIYDGIDLGIAVGSAVSLAADRRIDCRVMFSVGRAALEMGYFSPDIKAALGVPLSVSKKSPFFDRA